MEAGNHAITIIDFVIKVIDAIAMPLVVGVLGYIFQKRLAENDRLWKEKERLIERRIEIYNEIRKDINRIYCFIEDVGSWKGETPETVISYKRHADEVMHTNQAVWEPDTFDAYMIYMDMAFKTYTGAGKDAQIKTSAQQKSVGIPGWNQKWENMLTGRIASKHKEKYKELIALISRDLKGLTGPPSSSVA